MIETEKEISRTKKSMGGFGGFVKSSKTSTVFKVVMKNENRRKFLKGSEGSFNDDPNNNKIQKTFTLAFALELIVNLV